jgi:hypothetical protein
VLAVPAPATAGTPALEAGVGRADITPPTGYFMLGWARGDARISGQHTRLYARALVLREGARKVALVAEDLNSIPGGMVEQAVHEVADLGYTPRDVIVSAGHTHAGPTGFSNFGFKNSVNPTPQAPTSLVSSPDPALYASWSTASPRRSAAPTRTSPLPSPARGTPSCWASRRTARSRRTSRRPPRSPASR